MEGKGEKLNSEGNSSSCWRTQNAEAMSSANTSSGSLILDVTSTSSDGGQGPPESPLDVLSRAASMMENMPPSPDMDGASPPQAQSGSSSRAAERSPSFKERTHPKFRKSTTPDYLMAADQARHGKHANKAMDQDLTSDQPLDMSVKKRSDSPPPPPPYKYTPLRRGSPPRLEAPPLLPHYLPPPPYPCNNNSPSPPAAALPPPPSYESSTRAKKQHAAMLAPDSTTPSIGIKPERNSVSPPLTRTIREITIITADSSADPLLDEHFRRSLGANYENLFKKNSGSNKGPVVGQPPVRSPPLMSSSPRVAPVSAMEQDRKRSKKEESPVRELNEEVMDGCSVEDHFAKALGDTWLKLQAQKKQSEKEAKQGNSKAKVLAL